MAVQDNGRIVLAGYCYGKTGYRIAALRLLPSGELDPSFGNSGFFARLIGYESAAYAALVQRNGKS